MRILVAFDAYKGSLSAAEAGKIIGEVLRAEIPRAIVDVMPMADGGEGTVDALLANTGGTCVRLVATGPMGTPVNTFYGVIPKTGSAFSRAPEAVAKTTMASPKTVSDLANPVTDTSKSASASPKSAIAVMETAAVAGLPLVPPDKRNPLAMTTYGLGECIRHALEHGIRRFIIGLGGSATNDGGLGMLQALGAAFYDAEGNRLPDFKPIFLRDQPANNRNTPATVPAKNPETSDEPPHAPQSSPSPMTVPDMLLRIARVDFATLDPRLKAAELLIASDVQSPLCGPQGASAVFGPQKGATPDQVRILDEALAFYAGKVEQHVGRSFRHRPGAGAAGGLGFAFLSIGGQIHPGARLVIQASGLADKLPGAHWLITGEGKTDEQTLLGKLPVTLAEMARAHGVRTILVSGSLTGDEKTLEKLYRHFDALFAIPNRPMTLEEAMRDVRPLLKATARSIARLIGSSGSSPNNG